MKSLIELSYLTESCFLSGNVDERKFTMSLKLAQEQLRTVLGPEYYEEIEAQFSTVPTSFTTDNNTLYEDYIKDFLAWQTYVEFLAFSQLDSTPTGFRQHNDNTSELASDVKFYSLTKNVSLKAEDYKNKMINFLKLAQEKDSTKYPMWTHCQQETFAFGISSVSGKDCGTFSVNKAIIRNE